MSHEIDLGNTGGGASSPLQESLRHVLDAVIEARLATIEADLEGVASAAIQTALSEAEATLIALRDGAQQAADSITNMQVATGEPGSLASWDGTTLTVPRGADGAASLPIGAPGQFLGYGPGGAFAALNAPVATWDSMSGKPSTYPPAAHRHGWADLDGVPGAFPPGAHGHAWAEITGRPSAFPPVAHVHAVGDVTGLQAALDSKAAAAHSHSWADVTGKPAVIAAGADPAAARAAIGAGTSDLALGTTAGTAKAGNWMPTWANVSGKPSSFTPASHRHDASEIDNLPIGGGGGPTAWADVTGKPSEFPPNAHSHAWSEITDRPETFAPSAHAHAWADITDKPAIIAAGADQAAARAAIGAGTSNLTIGTSGGTAKAGNYQPTWGQVTGKPTVFPPSGHGHGIEEITGLQTVLDGKQPATSFKTVNGEIVTGTGDIVIPAGAPAEYPVFETQAEAETYSALHPDRLVGWWGA